MAAPRLRVRQPRVYAGILDPVFMGILDLAQLPDLAFMETLDDGQRGALDPVSGDPPRQVISVCRRIDPGSR